MKIPFISLVVQGIPEQIAMVTLAFVLAKIPLEFKKIILSGLSLALASYFIRLFPVTFGIHTIIIMAMLFVLLSKIGKTGAIESLKYSLIVILILILVESSSVALLMSLTGLTMENFHSSITIRILLGLPQVIILFLISFIIIRLRSRKKNI